MLFYIFHFLIIEICFRKIQLSELHNVTIKLLLYGNIGDMENALWSEFQKKAF